MKTRSNDFEKSSYKVSKRKRIKIPKHEESIYVFFFFRFNELFNFNLTVKTYRRNFINIKVKIHQLGKNAELKQLVLDKFGTKAWQNLSNAKKAKHTVFDCKDGCLKDEDLRYALGLFPIDEKDFAGKKRAEVGGLFRPTSSEVQSETKSLVSELNSQYRTMYGTTFDSQYRKCKGQKTKAEVRRFQAVGIRQAT